MSKLVDFFADYKRFEMVVQLYGVQWPKFSIDINPTLSELCSWLLRHADDSVRGDIATGLSWGLPAANSGIEAVVASFLNEPKDEREFYCAASWCLRSGIVPLRLGFEPTWVARHPDPSRAASLASAWSIFHTMISNPEQLVSVLNEHSTEKGLLRPVARELSRMLYGPKGDHTSLVRGISERIRYLPSIDENLAPHVTGLLGRYALTIAAASPPLARSYLSLLSERGLKPSIQKTAANPLDPGFLDLMGTFNSCWMGAHALRNLFTGLEACPTSLLPPRLGEPLINLSFQLLNLYDRTTPESLTFRSLYLFAEKLGFQGVRALLDGPKPKLWTDAQWREQLDEEARNILSNVPDILASAKLLGLEREVSSFVFTKVGMAYIKRDGCIGFKSIKFADRLPEHERYPIIEQAIISGGELVLKGLAPSFEALILLGRFPSLQFEYAKVGWEVADIFSKPRRGAEAFQFLSSCPDQSPSPSIEWPGLMDPKTESLLKDRFRFLSRFSAVSARTSEPLEALYKRLDDPRAPYFSREAWKVSEMLAISQPVAEEEVVPLFEKLARDYAMLPGGILRNIDIHQRLLVGRALDRLEWREALLEHPHKLQNLDLEREFQAFAEYVRIFGHYQDDQLYSYFSRHFCLDSFHSTVGEMITPQDYKKRLEDFKIALAEDRFNFAALKHPQDPSVLRAAIGGGALESQSFLTDISNVSLRMNHQEEVVRPPLATFSIQTIQRGSVSLIPQLGVMQRVQEFRDLLLSIPSMDELKKSVEGEAGALGLRLRGRVLELQKIEGHGAFFARRNIESLEQVATALAGIFTLNDFIECCARGQPAYGKEIDSQVVGAIRKLGIQALQDKLPSRHRSWTDAVYDEREQLEGCVGVIREELRDAKLALSAEGRSLWKRAFSVRGLEDEVSRLHALDLQVAGMGNEIDIDVRKGGDLLSNIAGYVCHTCVQPYPFTDLLDQKITFADLHPKAAFYTFARRHEDGPRLIGGTFILDVTTIANERVWLVRGFNPLQNVALAVDVGALFEKFIDSVALLARAEGIKHIAVPYDLYSGRTQTNRPTLHAYIARAYYGQPYIIKLAPHQPLNSLPVVQACVVRTLP